MFNSLRAFWAELLSIAKTWPIRRQMLLCYIIAIAVCITMVMTLVVLNTLLLLSETVIRIDETRDYQASFDLKSLIDTKAAALCAEISNVEVLLTFINNFLIYMYRDSMFALDAVKSFQFDEIPYQNMTKIIDIYGDQNISLDYSIYYPTGAVNSELLDKTSRLNYIWPYLQQLTSKTLIRYILYFEEAQFMVVYPGALIPDGYDPQDQVWYKTFIKRYSNVTRTTAYPDTLGNDLQIVSFVYPLYDINKSRIGMISVDMPVEYLYQKLSIQYLGKGDISLISKTGDIIRSENYGFWSEKYKTMDDIPYAKFWTNVKNNFEGIQYLIDNDDIYRVATVPLNSRLYPDNSGYIVMLIVNEADIMVYKEDAKQKIKAEGSVFITVTLACSLFTTVIILYLIHRQSKNITEPLQGIIDFTYKLNTAKKIDMDELMKLKEGEFQIERLVQAYKCLAGSLINKHDEYEVPAGNVQKAYPPNELHRPGRILWKDCFDKIPN